MAKLSPEGSKLHDVTTKAVQESSEGAKKTFSQHELIELGGLKDAAELMILVTELVSHQLFRTLKADRTLYWAPRTRDVAAQ